MLAQDHFPHGSISIEHSLLQTAVLLPHSMLMNKTKSRNTYTSKPDTHHAEVPVC